MERITDYTDASGTTHKDVIILWEPRIGVTICDKDGREFYCGNGTLSPRAPDLDNFAPGKWDIDGTLQAIIDYVSKSDSVSAEGIDTVLKENDYSPGPSGKMICAFN